MYWPFIGSFEVTRIIRFMAAFLNFWVATMATVFKIFKGQMALRQCLWLFVVVN